MRVTKDKDKVVLAKRMGNRLRDVRIDDGLTQQELAKKLAIPQAQLSHWETGHNAPSIYHLRYLASMFQTTTDYLLMLTDDRYQPSRII